LGLKGLSGWEYKRKKWEPSLSMVKSHTGAKEAHTAGAYPSFCSMEQLKVLLLHSGWDASPSQGYPQQYARQA